MNPLTDLSIAHHLSLLAQGESPGEMTLLQSFFSNPLLPGLALVFFYYNLVHKPEKRKRQEDQKMRSGLQKNDRIVMNCGIHGTVVSAPAESHVITIKIDQSGTTRVKVNRSAIAGVINEKAANASGEETN